MRGGFDSLHPFACFFYYAGLFLFSMILLHPIFLATALVGLLLLNWLQDGGKRLRSSLLFFLFMGAIVFIVNPLLTHRGSHILFYWMDKPFTLEAILYGFTMMLSLLCMLVGFVSYNQVITSGKFLFLFARILPNGALLAMLSIRFVPLLKRRLREIALVQRTKGVDPLTGPLAKRAKDGMLILQVLLTWSLEEALQTADSMKARGYGSSSARSSYIPYRFSRRDLITLTLLVLLFATVLLGWIFAGYGQLQIFPRLSPIGLRPTEWIFYSCFALYIFIPNILEGREKIIWPNWN